ncbi:glycosyltransferase family 39 protein [bacterium]|nr:glycosyltransferase family 39 protein [bacterium]
MSKQKTTNKASGARIIEVVKNHWILLFILAIHILIWLYLNQYLTPHSDFVDHWMQSRVWSLSYYEHPPMVAIFIKALTAVFGSSEMGLETSALTFSVFLNICAYAFTVYLYNKRAGIFTVLLMEASPFFLARAASIQTEQPLVFFWIVSLLVFIRYIKTGKNYWLIVLGIFTGLGALSKYTMILFYVSMAVYITVEPNRRKEWLNPWQLLGGLTSLAIFSPVLIWNSLNDWVSFRFQLEKGSVDEGIIFGLSSVLFLIGVLGAFSLITMIWGYTRMFRHIKTNGFKNPDLSLEKSITNILVVFSIVPILVFTLAMARNEYHDPHWAVLAVITFYVWLGHESSRLWEAGKKRFIKIIYSTALILNFVVFFVIFSYAFKPDFNLPYFRSNLVDHIFGWDSTVSKAEKLLKSEGYDNIEYVISPFYPLASQFALHLSSQPRSYCLERTKRNLWSDPNKMNSKNTIAVCTDSCSILHSRIGRAIGLKIEKLGVIRSEVTRTIRTVEIYRIVGRDETLLEPDYINFDKRLLPIKK